MNKTWLNGKVAIVTGSSQGIGRETAALLLELGAAVVLNGRNPDRLHHTAQSLSQPGRKVSALAGDVSNPEFAKMLVHHAVTTFDRLDILINNAGVSMRGDFADLSPAVVKNVMDINVLGSIYPSQFALPHLRKSSGSLVFVSSLAGIRGLPGNSIYCASKMALRAVAESIRIEEAGEDLHVGLILVGITDIEQGKTTIGADGQLIELQDRSKRKVQSMESVAHAILKNIRKRRFRTTLTGIGKLNAIMHALFPDLVEKILIANIDKIKARNV